MLLEFYWKQHRKSEGRDFLKKKFIFLFKKGTVYNFEIEITLHLESEIEK